MTPPIIARASSLPGYTDCPRRWATRALSSTIRGFGYTLNQTPISIAASVGTGVHGGAAHLLNAKMNGREAKTKDAEDVAVEEFRTALTEAEKVSTDDVTPNVNAAERQIARMVVSYAVEVLPVVSPLAVEGRLHADAGGGLILSGQSDLLCRTPDDAIEDIKTGKKRGNYRPQYGSYSLLTRTHGGCVLTVRERFIQRAPLTKPQPSIMTTVFDVAACETAARRILDHIADDVAVFLCGAPEIGIRAGDAWAFSANPSSMLCSPKWCPAFGSNFCIEHKETQK